MRKSITTRYFYSTAFLLVCGVALMWFIQMYLAMGYFRTENDENLLATVDNTIRILQEAGGSAAPGDEEAVEAIKRESRRYAKRQLTWLRKRAGALWIRWDDEPDFVSAKRDSTAFLAAHGII